MLKLEIALGFAFLALTAAGAGAQTKISGTIQCAKPNSISGVPVNDRPRHDFIVMKAKCAWTKPIELAGMQTKTGDDTVFSEASGEKSRDSGYDVTTMNSGDKFVVRFTGSTIADKTGTPQEQSGTWTFVSGTGKLKGISGKGIYKARASADGGMITDVEGEYKIATK